MRKFYLQKLSNFELPHPWRDDIVAADAGSLVLLCFDFLGLSGSSSPEAGEPEEIRAKPKCATAGGKRFIWYIPVPTCYRLF